jgi:hypothetical protein
MTAVIRIDQDGEDGMDAMHLKVDESTFWFLLVHDHWIFLFITSPRKCSSGKASTSCVLVQKFREKCSDVNLIYLQEHDDAVQVSLESRVQCASSLRRWLTNIYIN